MDEETKRLWAKRAGAGLAAFLGLLVLVWLFMPTSTGPRSRPQTVGELDAPGEGARKKVVQMASVAPADEPVELEDDPNIPVVTPNCKLLVGYERRKVPQYSILDTLRDSSMRFDEDDLACLTAAGITPAILDLAEARVDYNKARGIKGKPGVNLTLEHETYLAHPTHPDNQK
ncbi:MAG: hypothetical protein H6736_13140 [Alphaproteobacteria bacterium]|nr:hypothetical protein [Alphaproteobacteria bacterium]